MNQPSEQDPLPVDEPTEALEKPAVARPAAHPRPSLILLGLVAGISLAADLGTKWWALYNLERALPSGATVPAPIEIASNLTLVLARNRGGAWGLLQTADESLRRPFFLIISALAIAFIVYLYRKVHPKQHALRWGLPLVLGGAIGNLVDRVRYGWVIDFIDYRGGWVETLNRGIQRVWESHNVTDHWPTFNVADIAICIGVGLMAIDMFTSRRIAKVEATGAGLERPSEVTAQPENSEAPAPTPLSEGPPVKTDAQAGPEA